MIKRAEECDLFILKKHLSENQFHNPYFYIDINMFGYRSDVIDTFVIEDCTQIYGYIYKYFNSLQLFIMDNYRDFDELADFILNSKAVMVSGSATIIKCLSGKLINKYTSNYGVIMSYERTSENVIGSVELANEDKCLEIAQLICSDNSIGGHYETEVLEKQLIERMSLYNCKNVYVSMDGRIVSHAATYADDGKLAIIGGVITLDKYRGLGLGKKAVTGLCNMLIDEGKIPLLYCYDNKTVEWYKKMNWNIVSECGKLVVRKGDV